MVEIRPPLLGPLADEIYDILIECGASDTLEERMQFCVYMCDPANGGATSPREWRFVGALGGGGKVHASRGKIYVDCYPEDLTEKRRAVIDAANVKLRNLIETTKWRIPWPPGS